MVNMTSPTFSFCPTLTFTSLTVPLSVEGTSTTALSVSNSSTVWPSVNFLARFHRNSNDISGFDILAQLRQLELSARRIHRRQREAPAPDFESRPFLL